MTDTSKELDAYRDRYLQNCTFILHGRGNKKQGLRLLCDQSSKRSQMSSHGINKCQTAKLTNARNRSPANADLQSSAMPFHGAKKCLPRRSQSPVFDAHQSRLIGARKRRPLALANVGFHASDVKPTRPNLLRSFISPICQAFY